MYTASRRCRSQLIGAVRFYFILQVPHARDDYVPVSHDTKRNWLHAIAIFVLTGVSCRFLGRRERRKKGACGFRNYALGVSATSISSICDLV